MVKRVYDLYPQVHSYENLILAEMTAARGKRGRPDVAAFEYHLDGNLLRLRDGLRAKTYRPGPYRRFTIREPKQRVIAAAPFRDRVVHHALCRIIEPHFERRFCRYSYASRLGKGTHAALDRCTLLARRFPYVLRCDIVKFFPTMDHGVLRAQLARVIGDTDILWLCDLILAGGAEPSGSPLPRAGEGLGVRAHGLPIGNQTSQFWANVYLNPLDQFVTRELRCPGYVRYVDDFLLFAPDKPTLHAWRRAVYTPDDVLPATLALASADLDKLRHALRLCHDLSLITSGQYEYAAERLSEIGRLLGGWRKTVERQSQDAG